MKLLIATANRHKAEEIAALLPALGLEYRTLADYPAVVMPEETGSTLEENARLKAVSAARQAGVWTLADDTGLEVDALGGAPGVYSARYCGRERDYEGNNRKLLAEMERLGWKDVSARFRCVVCLSSPEGKASCVEGSLEGEIIPSPRGTAGFGYDPVFLVKGLGKTLAELSFEEKNRLSHRNAALAKAAPRLSQLANSKYI